MADKEEMVDTEIKADDNIIVEDKTGDDIKLETTVVPLDEQITAAKLQTIQEQNVLILSNQNTIMQALADIQNRLQLEARMTNSDSKYQTLLKQYMSPVVG